MGLDKAGFCSLDTCKGTMEEATLLCLDEDNALPFHCHWSWDKSEAPKVRVQNSDEDVQLCSLSLFISQSTGHFFFSARNMQSASQKTLPISQEMEGWNVQGGESPVATPCPSAAPRPPPGPQIKRQRHFPSLSSSKTPLDLSGWTWGKIRELQLWVFADSFCLAWLLAVPPRARGR